MLNELRYKKLSKGEFRLFRCIDNESKVYKDVETGEIDDTVTNRSTIRLIAPTYMRVHKSLIDEPIDFPHDDLYVIEMFNDKTNPNIDKSVYRIYVPKESYDHMIKRHDEVNKTNDLELITLMRSSLKKLIDNDIVPLYFYDTEKSMMEDIGLCSELSDNIINDFHQHIGVLDIEKMMNSPLHYPKEKIEQIKKDCTVYDVAEILEDLKDLFIIDAEIYEYNPTIDLRSIKSNYYMIYLDNKMYVFTFTENKNRQREVDEEYRQLDDNIGNIFKRIATKV